MVGGGRADRGFLRNKALGKRVRKTKKSLRMIRRDRRSRCGRNLVLQVYVLSIKGVHDGSQRCTGCESFTLALGSKAGTARSLFHEKTWLRVKNGYPNNRIGKQKNGQKLIKLWLLKVFFGQIWYDDEVGSSTF